VTNEEIAKRLRSIADSIEPGPAHGSRMSDARYRLRELAMELDKPPLPPIPEGLDASIDDLWCLGPRAYKALKNYDVLTIRQAMEMTDGQLLRLPGFGVKSLHDLRVSITIWCEEHAERAV
jgi:hypothetical protein